MAWEKRSGNRYYYRKYRFGKKVSSEYIGSGVTALQAEADDQLCRQSRAEEKRKNEQQMEAIHSVRAAEQPVIDFERWIRSIYESTLLSAGFHQHHREWRKRRCQNQ